MLLAGTRSPLLGTIMQPSTGEDVEQGKELLLAPAQQQCTSGACGRRPAQPVNEAAACSWQCVVDETL